MKTDIELQRDYPELYVVARQGSTEPAYSSDLLHVDDEGVFHCAVCDTPLFSSDKKFDSGTGWPSFTHPIQRAVVKRIRDTSHGMYRTEVRCAHCDAHLGHVFPDGPERTGNGPRDFGNHDRYCINGISLTMYNS